MMEWVLAAVLFGIFCINLTLSMFGVLYFSDEKNKRIEELQAENARLERELDMVNKTIVQTIQDNSKQAARRANEYSPLSSFFKKNDKSDA